MQAKINAANFEFTFNDSDIVNRDDAIWRGEYNPHNVRLWLLHDHGFTLAVVWADNLQDAIDIAVDNDKLDRYLIAEVDLADYGADGEGIAYLGNASEPFDIESLGYVEFSAPELSTVRLFGAEPIAALSYHV